MSTSSNAERIQGEESSIIPVSVAVLISAGLSKNSSMEIFLTTTSATSIAPGSKVKTRDSLDRMRSLGLMATMEFDGFGGCDCCWDDDDDDEVCGGGCCCWICCWCCCCGGVEFGNVVGELSRALSELAVVEEWVEVGGGCDWLLSNEVSKVLDLVGSGTVDNREDKTDVPVLTLDDWDTIGGAGGGGNWGILLLNREGDGDGAGEVIELVVSFVILVEDDVNEHETDSSLGGDEAGVMSLGLRESMLSTPESAAIVSATVVSDSRLGIMQSLALCRISKKIGGVELVDAVVVMAVTVVEFDDGRVIGIILGTLGDGSGDGNGARRR